MTGFLGSEAPFLMYSLTGSPAKAHTFACIHSRDLL